MIDRIEVIQPAILEALLLQASGCWRALEHLGSQGTGSDQPLANALLCALCTNPLKEPERGRASLNALAEAAPRSACAIGLSRGLLALAQEKILKAQRESAGTTLRQALASSVNAVAATGMPMPVHLPDQLLSQAGQLERTLASQLDLALASQRHQLPAQLVLVLGMHRSGTSALSGLLVKSGLDGPMDLMPATPENPRGYWESLGVMQLNDQLLQDLGYEWSSCWALPGHCWESNAQAVECWRSQMLNLLHTTYPQDGWALLKDPRLCVSLPGLRPWLESTLITCVAFLLVRHPAEVAESLWAAEGIPRSQGLLLWLGHVLQAERHSRGLNRLIVGHQQLLADPEAVLHRCYETLEQAGGVDALKPVYKMAAANFIDPQLHRQRAGAGLSGWVLEEQPDSFYSLALRVYTVMVETQVSEQAREATMDQLWGQWTTLSP